MYAIKVRIVRLVEQSFPGWVECDMTDAHGRRWKFTEKIPVLHHEVPEGDEWVLPHDGAIACEVERTRKDDGGREIVAVDTERPWGTDASDGTTRFEVYAEQLMELQ